MSNEKFVTVFCGSSPGKEPHFLEEAKKLSTELAQNDYHLVYGGASIGLMGAVADEFISQKEKSHWSHP